MRHGRAWVRREPLLRHVRCLTTLSAAAAIAATATATSIAATAGGIIPFSIVANLNQPCHQAGYRRVQQCRMLSFEPLVGRARRRLRRHSAQLTHRLESRVEGRQP